jgi:hypothetical protein
VAPCGWPKRGCQSIEGCLTPIGTAAEDHGQAATATRRSLGASESVPFKSQAQRRKFAQLLVEGKISAQTFEEWNRETGGTKLPERVKRTTKPRSGRTRRKP